MALILFQASFSGEMTFPNSPSRCQHNKIICFTSERTSSIIIIERIVNLHNSVCLSHIVTFSFSEYSHPLTSLFFVNPANQTFSPKDFLPFPSPPQTKYLLSRVFIILYQTSCNIILWGLTNIAVPSK